MNRFDKKQKTGSLFRSLIFPLAVFGLLFILFYYGISSISRTSATEERQSLETALNHAIVHSYSVEGRYPENLEEIVDHYGIIYDKTRYFVDYQPIAANIMPNITIICLEGGREF